MDNPFDKFDTKPVAASTPESNPFDQFGAAPASAASPAPAAKPTRSWSDVPLEAVSNIPSSAGRFVGGIAQAVAHPLDTIGSIADLGAGALQNALPQRVRDFLDKYDPNPEAAKRAEAMADATGQMFKDRYGSVEGLKETLATDPVGAAADLSTVLTGGAALAGKAGLTGTSSALRTAGNAVNPVTAAVQGGKLAARLGRPIGNAAANIVGGIGTHTGGETIKQAFKSGREGGASAEAFRENMRGNVPITDVLDDAKANIDALGRAKSEAYRQNMAAVNSDKAILGFKGIDQALDDADKVVRFKGQVKNVKAAQVKEAIADEIAAWKALDPAEFHTPEGLDALKQKIGGIVDSIPFEEKTAGLVGKKIYNSIKSEITKQAPVYADTMKEYTQATEQIREIERALSLGKNASVDTAMRKLQSLTRNNVNTNYGNRLDLARQLEEQGGRALLPALSGQAMSSWTPRGLGGVTAGGIGLGAGALGGLPAAAGALAVQSPRLVGETAHGAGRVANIVDRAALASASAAARLPVSPATAATIAYQAGRLPTQQEVERIRQNRLSERVRQQRALQGIGSAQTIDEAIRAASE